MPEFVKNKNIFLMIISILFFVWVLFWIYKTKKKHKTSTISSDYEIFMNRIKKSKMPKNQFLYEEYKNEFEKIERRYLILKEKYGGISAEKREIGFKNFEKKYMYMKSILKEWENEKENKNSLSQ